MPIECIANDYFVSGKSDCGKRRQRNEDRLLINASAGLVLVADGMGGHPDGDKASEFAVRTLDALIAKYLPLQTAPSESSYWNSLVNVFKPRSSKPNITLNTSLMRDVLIQTHIQLYQQNLRQGFFDGQGMGTTLVGCRVDTPSRSMTLFHVGDSRCYRLRQGQLEQLTEDHSAYQQWLESDQSETAPSRNVLWQTLGTQASIDPEIQMIELEEGDRFLLCSDGLSTMVDTATLVEVLANCRLDNLERSVQCLIDSANEAGGRDNITVAIICDRHHS